MMMRSIPCALALALTLLVTACGGDEQRPGGPVGPGTTNNTTPTTNAPPPTFEDSAQITIAITPQRAVHRTGTDITLAARVLDASGVAIPDVPLTWEHTPMSAATRGEGDQWRLNAQGEVRWRVCVEGRPEESRSFSSRSSRPSSTARRRDRSGPSSPSSSATTVFSNSIRGTSRASAMSPIVSSYSPSAGKLCSTTKPPC